jgi:LysM repeat protein
MTRETKIGLLVGLAFIIVIGILLSDYNRNEIQNAPLPQVADNVRSSTATMHNQSNQNEIVPPPAPIFPARTVPTPEDLHQRTVIAIGPGAGPTSLEASEHHRVDTGQPPVVGDDNNPQPGTDPQQRIVISPQGGPLAGIPDTIPVGPRQPLPAPQPPIAPAPPAPTVNGARQYVAVAGDTVNKLAGRFLGGNTKANREAIMAINPSLKANPNNVIVGKVYMIPAKGTVAVAAAAPAPGAPVVAAPRPDAPVKPAPVVPAPVAAAAAPGGFYTVKENDNLWRIAADQLGDGSQWEKIKELNADILKGREALRPNMRLRLPAKTVATAN